MTRYLDPDRLQDVWNPLVQLAVWIIGLVTTFLVEPPRVLVGDAASESSIHFAQFLLTVIAALSVVAMRRFKNAKYIKLWVWLAIASLIFGASLFFFYEYTLEKWVCDYDGGIVKGSSYTATASEYASANPSYDCRHLIEDAGGDVGKVWPENQMISRHLIMVAIYTIAILSFGYAVIASIQAAMITQGRRGRRV